MLCPVHPSNRPPDCGLRNGKKSNKEHTIICGRCGLRLVGSRPGNDDDIGLFGRVLVIIIDKHVVLRELVEQG